MSVPNTMRAARMYGVGEPLQIEELPVPQPRPEDVLVRVRACGIVPNLANVLMRWPVLAPHLPLPTFPAIFGLDPAGEIAAVGSRVHGLSLGQRVYVNPGRSCGGCVHCRRGDPIACRSYAFSGYFGFGEKSRETFADYPFGGLSEYMTAPASAVVTLSDSVTYEQAARFGYLGTAYSALRKANAGPSTKILINGGTGTLGLCAVMVALALGVPRIFITGRDVSLLRDAKALSPHRIETFGTGNDPICEWIKARTDQDGVDVVVDCLGPGAAHETFLDAMHSMRRGGVLVNAGAVSGEMPMKMNWLMVNNARLRVCPGTSCWIA